MSPTSPLLPARARRTLSLPVAARLAALSLLLAVPAAARAQGVQALKLEQVLEHPATLVPALPPVAWVPDSYLLATVAPDGKGRLAATRSATGGAWKPRFTDAQLRAALTAAKAEGVPDHGMPPFTWLFHDTLRVQAKNGIYHWTLGADAAERKLPRPAGADLSAIAPGDQLGAFVIRHDIHIAKPDGSLRRITWDGSEDIVYGDAAHRSEFGIESGLWWDDGGRRLAFSREDQRPNTIYPYADYSVQPPAPIHGRYPMAGSHHATVTIGVYDSADDSVRFLEADPELDLYQTNVTFTPDGTSVLVAQVNRGQDHMDLVRFDSATGKRLGVLFSESDPEWVEPTHGPIFLPDDSGRFLWFSPRDGYRHLYLYDGDGKLQHQVTHGAFDVRELVGFAGKRHALVMASGDDPLQMHLWQVDIESGAMQRRTKARGWHHCMPCTDGAMVLDRHSNLDSPGALDVLVTADGDATRLATAHDPMAGIPTGERRFFEVEAADGTPLHGLLLLPPAPAPDRKYPVLQYVYGGPHSQLVRDTWLGGANLWLHYMANRGFVVFVLDNHGTDNRGIEFAQSVYRRLGTLEVEDQVRGLRYVCSLDLADPTRVAVHGWSFGGFMTLSLMTRAPDLYACGVSGAPVTDWAQYETGYTERYMDTPQENPDGYQKASVVARAGDLRGRLLLIQGTDDKTVMFSQSMRFLHACIEAGTLVDFMAYPMQEHGFRGKDRVHMYRTMTRFFEEQLLRK